MRQQFQSTRATSRSKSPQRGTKSERLGRGSHRSTQVTVVVGYKLEHIIEAFPEASFVYNEQYDQTNTSKSLMRALQASAPGGVLWMNGDVVFDPIILQRLTPFIVSGRSAVAVNTAQVAEEEVKYTVDADGHVDALSKKVENALGEAVGINLVSGKDKARLIECLADCDEQDYFERGIELAIERHGIKFTPVDISDLFAVEIDFDDDLARANARG